MKIQTSEGIVDINIYKWSFITLSVLILIYFVACHKTVQVAPMVKPSSAISKATVNVDSIKKSVSDSFTIVVKNRDKVIAQKDSRYDDLMGEYLNQANDFSDSLANKKIPDTCKPYQLRLIAQYNNLAATSNQKDNASKSLISSLKEQSATKDSYLVAKEKSYNDLHSVLDTCVSGYKTMESFIKKSKPKHELNVGINMLSAYSLPLNTIFGLNVGYRDRKGFEVSVGYYTNNQVSIGLKKPLIRF